jgi:hypothetical protein
MADFSEKSEFPMQLTERHLEDISHIRCRIYTCEFETEHKPTCLVLAYSGTYNIGSDGNGDAAYMIAFRRAAMAVWDTNAFVYDLRELKYEWGNSIWSLFSGTFGEPDLRGTPSALVVSDLCKAGFSTCAGFVPPMFDHLDAALKHVEKEAEQKLRVDLQVFEGKQRPWWRFW